MRTVFSVLFNELILLKVEEIILQQLFPWLLWEHRVGQ